MFEAYKYKVHKSKSLIILRNPIKIKFPNGKWYASLNNYKIDRFNLK